MSLLNCRSNICPVYPTVAPQIPLSHSLCTSNYRSTIPSKALEFYLQISLHNTLSAPRPVYSNAPSQLPVSHSKYKSKCRCTHPSQPPSLYIQMSLHTLPIHRFSPIFDEFQHTLHPFNSTQLSLSLPSFKSDCFAGENS